MKFTRKIGAFALALILALTFCFAAFADSNDDFEKQMRYIGRDGSYTNCVSINNGGAFHVQDVKFYGRKIVGINPDGSFILGPWELLMTDTGERYLPNRYVQFAFSCDVMWGTDYPYSGIFWTDVNTKVDRISILLSGICRVVTVSIYVNNTEVYYTLNSDAHAEWKP